MQNDERLDKSTQGKTMRNCLLKKYMSLIFYILVDIFIKVQKKIINIYLFNELGVKI